MQTALSYSKLLENIKEIIHYHQSEDIRIKFLGILHVPTGRYLYSIGNAADETTLATDHEMKLMIEQLPNVLSFFDDKEILLEVMSCYPELEELTSEYVPKGYMEEIYSLLQSA